MQSGDGGTGFIPLGDFVTAEEPVWVWDADARRILWANQAGRALWGASSLEVLRARRFSAQNKAVVRMASLARTRGKRREWTETLTLAVAEGRRPITCYMQALHVSGGRPGLIVKVVGHTKAVAEVEADAGNREEAPVAETVSRKAVKSGSGAKSDRAALKAIAALMESASQPKKGKVSSPVPAKAAPQKTVAAEKPSAPAKPSRRDVIVGAPKTAPANGTDTLPPYDMPEALHLMLRELCHELRNPLTVILGFSERIRDGAVRNPEKVQSYAGNILESAELAMAILADFSASVLRPGMTLPKPETAEIRPAVAACVQLITPLATQAGLKVSRTVSGGLPRVKIGERGLKQILLNVLMNAVRHQKTGGYVRVAARPLRDGSARLTIADDGIGMTKKEVRDAMGGKRPPMSPEPNPSRSGLGLPLVKRLVEGAGGRFAIESERRKGTTVVITFPAAD